MNSRIPFPSTPRGLLRLALLVPLLLLGLSVAHLDAIAVRAQAGPRPTITAVSPSEVGTRDAPVTLMLTGNGFSSQATVQLAAGQGDTHTKSLQPQRVGTTQLSVTVDADWFASLAQLPASSAGAQGRPHGAVDHFDVSVANPGGQTSNAVGVHLKTFAVRVNAAASQAPLKITTARWNDVPVSIERGSWQGDVTVVARAFEAPTKQVTGQTPQHGVLRQIDGVHGFVVIPAGQSHGILPIYASSTAPTTSGNLNLSADQLASTACQSGMCISAQSAVEVVGPCFPNCPPNPPSSLAISGIPGQAEIDLRWWNNDNPPGTGYALERQNPGVTPWAPLTQGPYVVTKQEIQYADVGLQDHTAYCYRVRAFNAFGSVYSVQACATTAAAPPPTPPTLVSVQSGGTQTSFLVTWQAEKNDADGYTLRRTDPTDPNCTPGSFCVVIHSWLAAQVSQGVPIQVLDAGLKQSIEYCYQVVASNHTSDALSDSKCDMTTAPPPPGGNNPPALPDLVPIGSLGLADVGYYPNPGQPFTLYTIVCNVGGGSVTGTWTDRFRQDDSTNTDVTLPPLGESTIAPNGCYQDYWVYANGLPAGEHHWDFWTDVNNNVSESIENNNYNYLAIDVS